jgi:hypothetical protein
MFVGQCVAGRIARLLCNLEKTWEESHTVVILHGVSAGDRSSGEELASAITLEMQVFRLQHADTNCDSKSLKMSTVALWRLPFWRKPAKITRALLSTFACGKSKSRSESW